MAPGIGGIRMKLFSSLLGAGALHIIPLPCGVQETPEEKSAWSRLNNVLRRFEKDVLGMVAPVPFSGESMRLEAFTGEAALQLLPEGHFSTCHVIDDGTRGVHAVVYEGAVDGELRFDGSAAGDPDGADLNVMAKACFTLWQSEGAWRLQSVECGEFSLIISITPAFNPEVATVRPGPGGTREVTGSHWDLKLRRERKDDPLRFKSRKLRPVRAVGHKVQAVLRLNSVVQKPPLKPVPGLSTSMYALITRSAPDLTMLHPKGAAERYDGTVLPAITENSRTFSKTGGLAKLPSPNCGPNADGARGMSFRWMPDATNVQLSFAASRPLGGAIGAASVAVLHPEQDTELDAMQRTCRRQARIAAMNPEHRRQLLFSPQFGSVIGKASRSRLPVGSRVLALELHLLNDDARMDKLRPKIDAFSR